MLKSPDATNTNLMTEIFLANNLFKHKPTTLFGLSNCPNNGRGNLIRGGVDLDFLK